jgi:murein DD-endopeptidase MepM/ murein hydrolase activator NlpD
MLGKKVVHEALVLIVGMVMGGAVMLACAADRAEVFTGLVVQPMISPRPVAGADGRVHLAYELSFVNETKMISQVDSIAAVDADSGAVLAEWKGKELSEIFRINGGETGTALGPSHSAYAFLDVALPASATAPKNIRHRISVSRSMPGASNEHKGAGGELQTGMPASVTFEGVPTPVDTKKPIVVAPPLRGPGWVAVNGCCAQISAHRGSVLAFNGKAYIAQRFAIDWIRVDTEGRLFKGGMDQLSSYPFFGVPVYAAAGGTVVEATDGMPEQVPGPPKGVTVETLAGNHIVVDMGDGNFALYAHIKTGTVAVKVGDHVKTGDVLGHLGNTGNSSAPHLHFHVMDGPSPLASRGLPYEIEGFASQGRLDGDDGFFEKGDAGKIDRNWFPGAHKNELPLENEVVDFGEGK